MFLSFPLVFHYQKKKNRMVTNSNFAFDEWQRTEKMRLTNLKITIIIIYLSSSSALYSVSTISSLTLTIRAVSNQFLNADLNIFTIDTTVMNI